MNEIIVPTDLDAIAERIGQRIRRLTSDIIETGKDLRLVKERLGHGQFLNWIDAKFRMKDRTALRYMRAAEWAEDKSDIVSDLPPTTVYLLAQKTTPQGIQQKVIADLEAGHRIDPREVEARVKMARNEQRIEQSDEQRRKTKNFRRSAKYRERLAREKRDWEREREERREREVAMATEIIGLLKKLPAEDFNRIHELMSSGGHSLTSEVVKLMKEDTST